MISCAPPQLASFPTTTRLTRSPPLTDLLYNGTPSAKLTPQASPWPSPLRAGMPPQSSVLPGDDFAVLFLAEIRYQAFQTGRTPAQT